ncbi:uncharacterized protein LOC141605324 [Silene latifolia]|uniref:uncharacterized protein LOC141605324 n=1 Tax=Silene latifolia TaxID=37657 RepID=UPI003D76CF44
MVSFQTPFLELNQRKTTLESDTNSKKRKWDHDPKADHEDILPFKHWMNHKGSVPATASATTTTRYFSDIELHLETPLPSEWQRCLDIQSGEIHFYNTRTQKRTVRDPRETSEEQPTSPPRDCHMSLDLELNLPCGSRNHNSEETKPTFKNKSSLSPQREPTNLFKNLNNTIERNFFHNLKESKEDVVDSKEDGATEMVAAACMRCHMLVMLQKSSPTCPNCKFVHPPYHSPPDLFKPTLSLSC